MVDDTAEQQAPAEDSGRTRRPPPTIDLTATEVSEQKAPESAAADASAAPVEPESKPGETASDAQPQPEFAAKPAGPKRAGPVSPWLVAPLSGAVAAAVVVAVGFAMGWIPSEPPSPSLSSAQPPNAAAIEDLTARLTSLEARGSRPAAAAPDQATVARVDALDKSLATVRGEVATLHAQSDKLAAAVSEAKAPSGEPASAPDLSEVNERIARLDQAVRAQGALIAKNGETIAKNGETIADAKPADDLALRRVVAATLLDVAVRHGDPYAALLTTAKSLAPSPDPLKPLDAFAASGVPSPAVLDRELLTLVPKLSPPVPDTSTTGTSIVDRLQAGAARLVRIERTDTAGSDRGAITSRVTAAALRDDFAAARRELNSLAPADRAAAQGWLDKADARDAALAASRHFADESMTSLVKPAQ